MDKQQKFYFCKHCGNLIGMIHSSGAPIVCCGDPMTQLVANTTEAAVEKHIPVVEVTGNRVSVQIGSVAHPMTEEHHIAWAYLQTNQGGQRKMLAINGKPEVEFALMDGEKVISAFIYCNLHGLWKTDVK